MKIRLEKPVVNISKLTGGKNEKARRGALHTKIRSDLYFFTRNNEFLITRRRVSLQKNTVTRLLNKNVNEI